MELKEGMRVKLKPLDEINPSDFDTPPGISLGMRQFFGNFVTIYQKLGDRHCFRIREDTGYYFLIRWIEEDENKMKIPDNIKRMV